MNQTSKEILTRHVAALFAPTPLWMWAEARWSAPPRDAERVERTADSAELLPRVEFR